MGNESNTMKNVPRAVVFQTVFMASAAFCSEFVPTAVKDDSNRIGFADGSIATAMFLKVPVAT